MEPQQEGPSFQTPTRFTLLPTQLQILQEALADVKNLDSKKERRRKIKTIRTQILALPESQTLDANGKEDLGAAINTWFSLRAKRQTDKLKFGKKWNARLVFHQQNKEKVQETQLKLYQKAIEKGENPKRQFDFLQLAISKLWKKQSKAERNGLEKLAKQWNKEGAPREQKQTAANKNTWKYTKKFAHDMYNSLGVRFLFLVALETPAGLVNTGIMDFNDELGGGASYMAKNADWEMEGIDRDSWNHHNRDYYNSEQIPPSVSSTKVPRVLTRLDRNDFGEPILPNPLLVPSRQTSRIWRQALVRAFMTYHYSLASGSERSIPWKSLLPRFRECVEEEHLPADLLSLLGEPSTMKDDHCLSLLTFWYRRQTQGVSPVFRFQKYLIKNELVEALPREQVDIPQTATSPIASGSNVPQTDTPPIASSSNIPRTVTPPIAGGSKEVPPARMSGTRSKKKKRNRKSKDSKSGKQNSGKGKERAIISDSEEASAQSTSDSDSHRSRSTTTSESDPDSSTNSDSEEEQSSACIHNVSPHLNPDLPDLYTSQIPYSSKSQPLLHHSNAHVDPVCQADEFSGDENMFPSPTPNLGWELRSMEKMIKEGIPRDEILQAFGAMRVRSQSKSPVKGGSHQVSPPTHLGKRRGRPSSDELTPASPTKKGPHQALEEPSPHMPTTTLPDTPQSAHTSIKPPSMGDTPDPVPDAPDLFDSTDTAPVASFTPSQAPGAQTTSISRGGGRKGQGSIKNTHVPATRVTRSSAPKKRITRANAK